MAPSERRRAGPIRLAILDDNAFVREADGPIRPIDATFHRFAEAVVRLGPFGRARYLAPVGTVGPGMPRRGRSAIDERVLDMVPTAPFDSIAGYLRRLPTMVRHNWPILRREAAHADLCWIKVPASNAALMAAACRLHGTARFAYVAGSVSRVVMGQGRGILGAVPALAVAAAYDGVTRILRSTGPSLVLDDDLFTSVVTEADVAATPADPPERPPGAPLRLVWAGRMTAEKGLPDLVAAVARLDAAGLRTELALIGDGSERGRLEAIARDSGVSDSIRWLGDIGDRDAYFGALREGDVFVSPSRSEGIPKTVVEAMVAGVPVIATAVGGVERLLDHGRRGVAVQPGSADGLADGIRELAADAPRRAAIRRAALEWASGRTVDAQARRLIAWLAAAFPRLPWGGEAVG